MSGLISDMMTASMARHARALVENRYHNGHPDLIVDGVYADNSVKAGERGVEVKSTRKTGGAVDAHGARAQWMCVFVYRVDNETEPATDRDEVHRNLSRAGRRGGLSQEPARRAGHPHRYAPQGRHPETPRQLGISGHLSASSFGIARSANSRYRSDSSTPTLR